ncbi:MAG: autotransporter outer membrane beta-barrel domain-containing protein [Pseudomonadota bacterium]
MDSGRGSARLLMAALAGTSVWALTAAVASAQAGPNANTPALIAAAGGNPQLAATAAYVGQVCPNLAVGSDLRNRCGWMLRVAAATPDRARIGLDMNTPQELLAQGATVDGAVSPATTAVAGRLSALTRLGGSGRVASLNRPILLASAGDTAGLGGASVPRLQAFANVSAGTGDRDADAYEGGYDFDQRSITAGLDYRFSDRFTGGVALSYGDTEADFDLDAGELQAKAFTVSAYGLWTLSDKLQVTALVAYGRIDYDSDRDLFYTEDPGTVIDRSARASTDGDQWEGTLTASYLMSGQDGWSYGPSLALSGRTLSLDGFSETGAEGLNLAFGKQSADSFQVILGFDVSKAVSTQSGIISPYARVQSVYETLDNRRSVAVRYAADTTGFFRGVRLTTSAPDRWRMLLGGGIAAQFAGGWSAFADAEATLGLRDTRSATFTLGARKEF